MHLLLTILSLYGPRNKVETIGRWLSQRQIYFRTPFISDTGIEVCNPHAPIASAPRSSGISYSNASSGGYVTRTVEEIRSDVMGMFDTLEQSESLPEIEADSRVLTPLLGHQKQGLYFLQNKEKERVFGEKDEDNNSLWRLRYGNGGRRTYYNVITGHEERQKPQEVYGGILADMMVCSPSTT